MGGTAESGLQLIDLEGVFGELKRTVGLVHNDPGHSRRQAEKPRDTFAEGEGKDRRGGDQGRGQRDG
jgi:hypothetical protein